MEKFVNALCSLKKHVDIFVVQISIYLVVRDDDLEFETRGELG